MTKKDLCTYQGKQVKEKMTDCKKKFVRYKEGAEIYSIGLTKFRNLPYHVRLLLDEFSNIGHIPKWDKLIATIRSREISASIPLVFKFGAEKGRVLLLVSFLIPAGICFGIYQLLTMLGVALTDQIVFILLCCSPLLALAWCYVMYQISYRIFVKQEL